MSIHFGTHSAAARRIITLMGRRRRLFIERPTRRRRYGWGRLTLEDYQDWRDRDTARIAALRTAPAGASKSITTWVRSIRPGEYFRKVDGHGRSIGPRLTLPSDLPHDTRVRRVQRQQEDLHSQLSRMMKRAHKAST